METRHEKSQLHRNLGELVRSVRGGLAAVISDEASTPRHGSARAVAALGIAFATGAVVGAGALLTFAPGAEEMRRALRSRARHFRDVIEDVELDVEDRLAAMRDRRAGRLPQADRPEGPFDFSSG